MNSNWWTGSFLPGVVGAVALLVVLLLWNGMSSGQVLSWFGGVSTAQLEAAVAKVQLTPGPAGEAGPAGEVGPKGDSGATGAAGPKGDTGAAGPKGDTGPAGPAGPVGPQGLTGPQGPKGDDVGPQVPPMPVATAN
jgi:hypothetical protein